MKKDMVPEPAVESALLSRDSRIHVSDLLRELERIDCLIQLQVRRARRLSAADEQFQGLYVSDAEVDDFLSRPAGMPRWAATEEPDDIDALDALAAIRSDFTGVAEHESAASSRISHLVRAFQLDPLDLDILLICLAPEIDLRYERLYGYLQDDITKRRPGVDLLLNLLTRSLPDKLSLRSKFSPEAPLFAHQLLNIFRDAGETHPTLLGHYVRVDGRIVNYLLGSDDVDARLSGMVQHRRALSSFTDLVFSPSETELLREYAEHTATQPMLFYIQGPQGAGRRSVGQVVAGRAGKDLLVVDCERLVGDSGTESLIRCASREAVLLNAALFFNNFDALLTDEREPLRRQLLAELGRLDNLAFLAANTPWEAGVDVNGRLFVRLELSTPSVTSRIEIWRNSLAGSITEAVDVPKVANSFQFRPGQIKEAAATARNLAWRRHPERPVITMHDVYHAARLHSNVRLASLARKLTPKYTWNDIILPEDRLQQLKEMCSFVNYRSVVYDTWGFDQKLSLGKGLNVLFAGPPGTGKTMAAEIIANDLGLDVYKIDLSMVVSKYIGETEKNLAKIFAEAESSNAILFFDEADALFGKRSEVRDAHDRYANIEIGYLLQRMEEYAGVVILASNFRKNMDDAFVRRLHFAVEFPMPDEQDRRRIWEGVWPHRTPRNSDVDFSLLAHKFEIAGGNIRNIALGSAFLAAADDVGEVRMRHVVRATRREYQKMGKVVMVGEFRSELPDPDEEELDA